MMRTATSFHASSAPKRRFDQVIKVSVGRKFLEWSEFVEWAKTQSG
jgi:hypothetical protein